MIEEFVFSSKFGFKKWWNCVFGKMLQVLDKLDAVLDVGGVYDPSRYRYDHHQKGFEEVFGHGFTTKLSSAGLVYKVNFTYQSCIAYDLNKIVPISVFFHAYGSMIFFHLYHCCFELPGT